MLTSPLPATAFHGETCARCKHSPGHPADLEAFQQGHTWGWRELFGTWFCVCAACRLVEVAWVAVFNEGFYERQASELGRSDGT